MTTNQAQSAVSLSAFVVATIFAYRKLVESPLSSKPAPPTAHFVIGFGFAYVLLSLAAQAAPTFGGMMAILVAAGDVLVNGQPLITDLNKSLTATQAATAGARASSTPSPAAASKSLLAPPTAGVHAGPN